MKKPLIVIAGPTASGKTGAAAELAVKINGEIISADSMQVYKYMDIGTAKATSEEMRGIKHYMIDEIYPDEEFSAALYQTRAKQYLEEIYAKGKIPIIAGGTGFYINALIYDNELNEAAPDMEYRAYLAELAEHEGAEAIHTLLKTIDQEAAEAIHPNDMKKVIRALEYNRRTGGKISEHNKSERKRELYYDVLFFVLDMEREKLYERINLRVDIMLKDGLIEEVKGLLDKGYDRGLTSMQGLGYKETAAYLCGEYDLETAVELIKRNTRRYAKRQVTWFKHQAEGQIWINAEKKDDMIQYVKQHGFIF